MKFLSKQENNRILAQAQNTKISKKDIQYRIKIQEIRGGYLDIKEICVDFIREALEKEVCKNNNQTPTEKEIIELDEQVTETSRAPELLKKIREIFRDDKENYYNHIINPILVNTKLQGFYARNKEFHKNEIEKVEKAWGKVWEGKSFQEVAEEYEIKYKKYDISASIEVPDEIKQYIPQTENPLFKIVKELKDKEIYKNIVEDDYSFQIIKRAEKTGEGIEVESLIINKKLFDDWFKEEAHKVKIDIIDEELKKELKKSYSTIWWIEEALK